MSKQVVSIGVQLDYKKELENMLNDMKAKYQALEKSIENTDILKGMQKEMDSLRSQIADLSDYAMTQLARIGNEKIDIDIFTEFQDSMTNRFKEIRSSINAIERTLSNKDITATQRAAVDNLESSYSRLNKTVDAVNDNITEFFKVVDQSKTKATVSFESVVGDLRKSLRDLIEVRREIENINTKDFGDDTDKLREMYTQKILEYKKLQNERMKLDSEMKAGIGDSELKRIEKNYNIAKSRKILEEAARIRDIIFGKEGQAGLDKIDENYLARTTLSHKGNSLKFVRDATKNFDEFEAEIQRKIEKEKAFYGEKGLDIANFEFKDGSINIPISIRLIQQTRDSALEAQIMNTVNKIQKSVDAKPIMLQVKLASTYGRDNDKSLVEDPEITSAKRAKDFIEYSSNIRNVDTDDVEFGKDFYKSYAEQVKAAYNLTQGFLDLVYKVRDDANLRITLSDIQIDDSALGKMSGDIRNALEVGTDAWVQNITSKVSTVSEQIAKALKGEKIDFYNADDVGNAIKQEQTMARIYSRRRKENAAKFKETNDEKYKEQELNQALMYYKSLMNMAAIKEAALEKGNKIGVIPQKTLDGIKTYAEYEKSYNTVLEKRKKLKTEVPDYAKITETQKEYIDEMSAELGSAPVDLRSVQQWEDAYKTAVNGIADSMLHGYNNAGLSAIETWRSGMLDAIGEVSALYSAKFKVGSSSISTGSVGNSNDVYGTFAGWRDSDRAMDLLRKEEDVDGELSRILSANTTSTDRIAKKIYEIIVNFTDGLTSIDDMSIAFKKRIKTQVDYLFGDFFNAVSSPEFLSKINGAFERGGYFNVKTGEFLNEFIVGLAQGVSDDLKDVGIEDQVAEQAKDLVDVHSHPQKMFRGKRRVNKVDYQDYDVIGSDLVFSGDSGNRTGDLFNYLKNKFSKGIKKYAVESDGMLHYLDASDMTEEQFNQIASEWGKYIKKNLSKLYDKAFHVGEHKGKTYDEGVLDLDEFSELANAEFSKIVSKVMGDSAKKIDHIFSVDDIKNKPELMSEIGFLQVEQVAETGQAIEKETVDIKQLNEAATLLATTLSNLGNGESLKLFDTGAIEDALSSLKEILILLQRIHEEAYISMGKSSGMEGWLTQTLKADLQKEAADVMKSRVITGKSDVLSKDDFLPIFKKFYEATGGSPDFDIAESILGPAKESSKLLQTDIIDIGDLKEDYEEYRRVANGIININEELAKTKSVDLAGEIGIDGLKNIAGDVTTIRDEVSKTKPIDLIDDVGIKGLSEIAGDIKAIREEMSKTKPIDLIDDVGIKGLSEIANDIKAIREETSKVKPIDLSGSIDLDEFKELFSIIKEINDATKGLRTSFESSNVVDYFKNIESVVQRVKNLVNDLSITIRYLSSDLKGILGISSYRSLYTKHAGILTEFENLTNKKNNFKVGEKRINSFVSSIREYADAGGNIRELETEIMAKSPRAWVEIDKRLQSMPQKGGLSGVVNILDEILIKLKEFQQIDLSDFITGKIDVSNLKTAAEEIQKIGDLIRKTLGLASSKELSSFLTDEIASGYKAVANKTGNIVKKENVKKIGDSVLQYLNMGGDISDIESVIQNKTALSKINKYIEEAKESGDVGQKIGLSEKIDGLTERASRLLEIIPKIQGAMTDLNDTFYSPASAKQSNGIMDSVENFIKILNILPAKKKIIDNLKESLEKIANLDFSGFTYSNQLSAFIKDLGSMQNNVEMIKNVASIVNATKGKKVSSIVDADLIEQDIYQEFQSLWAAERKQQLQDLGNLYVEDTEIERTTSGLVKLTNVIQDNTGAWKVLFATVNHEGEFLETGIKNLDNRKIAERTSKATKETKKKEPVSSLEEELKIQYKEFDKYKNEYTIAISKMMAQLTPDQLLALARESTKSGEPFWKTVLGLDELKSLLSESEKDVVNRVKGITEKVSNLESKLLAEGKFTSDEGTDGDLLGARTQALRNQYLSSLEDVFSSHDYDKMINRYDSQKELISKLIDKREDLEKQLGNIIGSDSAIAKMHDDFNETISGYLTGKFGAYDLEDRSGKIFNKYNSIKGFYHGNDIKRELEKYLRAAVPGQELEFGSNLTQVSGNVSKLTASYRTLDDQVVKVTATIDKSTGAIRVATTSAGDYVNGLDKFMTSLSSKLKEGLRYLMAYVSIQDLWRYFREGVEVVRELDVALTEMRKVSDEPLNVLKDFQKESFNIADSVGTTALQIQQSTADFMRLGDTLTEAKKNAATANTLLNVSEFESIDEATTSLIAMEAAYKNLSGDMIIDKLNNIGNNYAISTDGIATALQDSASALTTAGNDIDESIALITAGNAVVQDPNKVGNGLRTIALRLTGTKAAAEALQEIGEDTEGMITTESKLRKTILEATKTDKNLDGFDILNDTGQYKSTYEILQGIADIWEDIGEMDKKTGSTNQNLLLETMAGKNRANILASILQNPGVLKDVYMDSQFSEGSAEEELAKYLDSIDAKIQEFKNALQNLASDFLDSEILKFFIDLGTIGVNALDQIAKHVNVVSAAVALLMTTLTKKTGFEIFTFNRNGKDNNGNSKKVSTIISKIKDNGYGELLNDQNYSEIVAAYRDQIKMDSEQVSNVQSEIKSAIDDSGVEKHGKDGSNPIVDYYNGEKRSIVKEVEARQAAREKAKKISADELSYYKEMAFKKKESPSFVSGGVDADAFSKISESANKTAKSVSDADKQILSFTASYKKLLGAGDISPDNLIEQFASDIGENGKYKDVFKDSEEGFQKWYNAVYGGTNSLRKTFANLGDTIISGFVSGGISMLITAGLQLAVTGIYKLVTATKQAIEAGKEARGTIKDISNSVSNANTTIKSLGDVSKKSFDDVTNQANNTQESIDYLAKRYTELRRGTYNNENISLSDSDYQEFLDISNKLAEIMPELKYGTDDAGNAILNLGANASEASAEIKSLYDSYLSMQNIEIRSNLHTGFKGLQEELNELSNISYDFTSPTLAKKWLDQVGQGVNGNGLLHQISWENILVNDEEILTKFRDTTQALMDDENTTAEQRIELAERLAKFEGTRLQIMQKASDITSMTGQYITSTDVFGDLNYDLQQNLAGAIPGLKDQFNDMWVDLKGDSAQYENAIYENILAPLNNIASDTDMQNRLVELVKLDTSAANLNDIAVKYSEVLQEAFGYAYEKNPDIYNSLFGFDKYKSIQDKFQNLMSRTDFITSKNLDEIASSFSLSDMQAAYDILLEDNDHLINSFEDLKNAVAENRKNIIEETSYLNDYTAAHARAHSEQYDAVKDAVVAESTNMARGIKNEDYSRLIGGFNLTTTPDLYNYTGLTEAMTAYSGAFKNVLKEAMASPDVKDALSKGIDLKNIKVDFDTSTINNYQEALSGILPYLDAMNISQEQFNSFVADGAVSLYSLFETFDTQQRAMKYFTEDGLGVYSFMKDILDTTDAADDLGRAFIEIGKDGKVSFKKNENSLKALAQKFNISTEAAGYLLDAAKDIGSVDIGTIYAQAGKNTLSGFLADLQAVSAAMSEISQNGYLTYDTMTNLVTANGAYADALVNTGSGMILNTEQMREMNEQAAVLATAEIQGSVEELTDKYLKNTQVLSDFTKTGGNVKDVLARIENANGDLTKAIEGTKYSAQDFQNVWSAYTENQSLESTIIDLQRQQSEIRASVSLMKEYKDALQTPNMNANFLTTVGGKEGADKLYEQGWWGTDDFITYAKLIGTNGMDDKEAILGYQESLERVGKYLTEDASGVFTFFDDAIAKGEELGVTFDEMDGYKLNIDNMEAFAEAMGVTTEFAENMVLALHDAGQMDLDLSVISDGIRSDLSTLGSSPLNDEQTLKNAITLTQKMGDGVESATDKLQIMQALQNQYLNDNLSQEMLDYANENLTNVRLTDEGKIQATTEVVKDAVDGAKNHIEEYRNEADAASKTELFKNVQSDVRTLSNLDIPTINAALGVELADDASPQEVIDKIADAIGATDTERLSLKLGMEIPEDTTAEVQRQLSDLQGAIDYLNELKIDPEVSTEELDGAMDSVLRIANAMDAESRKQFLAHFGIEVDENGVIQVEQTKENLGQPVTATAGVYVTQGTVNDLTNLQTLMQAIEGYHNGEYALEGTEDAEEQAEALAEQIAELPPEVLIPLGFKPDENGGFSADSIKKQIGSIDLTANVKALPTVGNSQNVSVNVTGNVKEGADNVNALNSALGRLSQRGAVSVSVDTSVAQSQIQGLRDVLTALGGTVTQAHVGMEKAGFESGATVVNATLNSIGKKVASPTVSMNYGAFRGGASDVRSQMSGLDGLSAYPSVSLSGGSYVLYQIRNIKNDLDNLDGKTARTYVETVKTTKYSGNGTVALGTVHANASGTANAYAGGTPNGTDVGIKKNETALVNELGYESIVFSCNFIQRCISNNLFNCWKPLRG